MNNSDLTKFELAMCAYSLQATNLEDFMTLKSADQSFVFILINTKSQAGVKPLVSKSLPLFSNRFIISQNF